jgi:uncharacterized protein (TIGR02466 family)
MIDRQELFVFPTLITKYTNQYHEFMAPKLSHLIDSESLRNDIQTDKHLEKKEEYSFFFDWVYECLDDYKNVLQLDTENLKISLSWANISKNAEGFHTHCHPNSWVSGIYYLTDNPSPTVFSNPLNSLTKQGVVVQSSIPEFESSQWAGNFSAGDMILFPSWLHHCVIPQDKRKRVTISFNVMPSGLTSTSGLSECSY